MEIIRLVMMCFFLYLSPPCEPIYDKEKVNFLIRNIEQNLSLKRIKTFYCKFHEIKIFNSFPYSHHILDCEIGWDVQQNNFLYSESLFKDKNNNDNNRYLITETGDIIDSESIITSPNDNEKRNDQSSSLFDLLKTKIENQSLNYQKEIMIHLQNQKRPVFEMNKYLLCDNIPYNYKEMLFDDGKRENVFFSPEIGTSVPFFTFFGILNLFEITYENIKKSTFLKSDIIEYLKSPGPFFIDEKEDYIILWHRSRKKTESGIEIPVSYEIWLDPEYKIFRIDKVEYPSRILDKIDFSKSNYQGVVDCYTPKLTHERIQITKYKYVEKENFYIPIEGFYEIYNFDYENEEVKKLTSDYETGRITPVEYYLLSTQLPRITITKFELNIYPDSLRINEKLPSDIFHPPPLLYKTEFNIKQKPTGLIFILVCISFSLFTALITKYAFGWKIF